MAPGEEWLVCSFTSIQQTWIIWASYDLARFYDPADKNPPLDVFHGGIA
jgi:hypothetical protein